MAKQDAYLLYKIRYHLYNVHVHTKLNVRIRSTHHTYTHTQHTQIITNNPLLLTPTVHLGVGGCGGQGGGGGDGAEVGGGVGGAVGCITYYIDLMDLITYTKLFALLKSG